ncbi:GH12 family glycosyl hydrolase domain-containing protein [Asticcacaulis solisilvae]|uniref:GH12 family glycosyl hydrolase domain-containing protein n=1 Tax=Asticcacaulis solisilvae TaxID=1217274 RepID=UPI003FD803D4
MKTSKWLAPLAITCALSGAVFGAASADAATCTSAQYGSFTVGSFTFYNDMWGSGANTQTICANSASNWSITSNQPNTSGIKAYGNASYYVGKSLSSLTTLSSTLSESTPSGGAWDAAYDVWDSTNKYEIMIWMNYTGTSTGGGNVKPISYNWSSAGNAVPVYTNVSVGGSTWNVYEGSNGSNNVISFLRTTKTNNATTDIKAILNWIKGIGYFGNITVGQLQYGVEVTSTNSASSTWTMSNYTVTSK